MAPLSPAQKKLLQWVNGIAGVGHLASAIVLVALASNEETWRPALRTRYEVWNRLQSCDSGDTVATSTSDSNCFITSRKATEAYGIDVLWMCFFFAFWSGIVHLVSLVSLSGPRWLQFRETYIQDIEAKYNRFRWLDYIGSASVMIVVIAIYSGIDETWFLVDIGLAQAIVIFFGAYGEWLSSENNQRTWDAKIIFLATTLFYGFAVWGPIFQSFTLSIAEIPGTENVDTNLINGIFVSFFFTFSGFAFIYGLNLFFPKKVSYGAIELFYMILSLVSKTLLHWILFYAIFQRSETLVNEVFSSNSSGELLDETGILTVIIVILSLGIVAAIVAGLLWRRVSSSAVRGKTLAGEEIPMEALSEARASWASGARIRLVHVH